MASRRHLVVGDIHGCHEEFLELLGQAAVSPGDCVVALGDVVDRGPGSAAIVELFLEREGLRSLMGNHERKHVRSLLSVSQRITRLQLRAHYAKAVEWMRSLPYYLELDEAVLVHGGLEPGVPLASQRPEVLAGTMSGEARLREVLNGRLWYEAYVGPKPVLFGHFAFRGGPYIRESLAYGLDTGVCVGGRLTALSLPDFRLYSVPARTNHWAHVKQEWQGRLTASRHLAIQCWAYLHREAEQGVLDSSDPELPDLLREWLACLGVLAERTGVAAQALAAREAADMDRREFARRYQSHPAGPLLFAAWPASRARTGNDDGQWPSRSAGPTALALRSGWAGTLDREEVFRKCKTPARLLAAAWALGVEPEPRLVELNLRFSGNQ